MKEKLNLAPVEAGAGRLKWESSLSIIDYQLSIDV